MTEKQKTEPSTQEFEPRLVEYAVGDVVRIQDDDGELDPRLWLLTTLAKATDNGTEMGGIQIDEDGVGLGADGSILVDNIVEKVGPRKTPEEVVKIAANAFDEKYNHTFPRAEVVAMIARNAGFTLEE